MEQSIDFLNRNCLYGAKFILLANRTEQKCCQDSSILKTGKSDFHQMVPLGQQPLSRCITCTTRFSLHLISRAAWQSRGLTPENITDHICMNPAHLPDYGSSLPVQEPETGMEVVENILKNRHMKTIVLCIPRCNRHY